METDTSSSQSLDEAEEGLLVSASYPHSVVVQAADGDAVDDHLASSSLMSTTAVSESSFQSWVEDDRNVPPDNQVQYIIMMMITIDETFSVDVPPWSEQRGKKGFKPNLALYRRELRRRDPKVRVSNHNTKDLLEMLRRGYPITSSEDIEYITQRIRTLEATMAGAQLQRATTSAPNSRSVARKTDRLRFVECMVLDTVKPLYLSSQQVLLRYEMDGRKSSTASPDFYDVVSDAFNDTTFNPTSRCLPELHPDFIESIQLPLHDDYLMTPERAKSLIQSMKPKIAKMASNFEQSGNGDGMRDADDDDDDNNDDNNNGTDALRGLIEGSSKAAFLRGKNA
jgi:hypothetical protein